MILASWRSFFSNYFSLIVQKDSFSSFFGFKVGIFITQRDVIIYKICNNSIVTVREVTPSTTVMIEREFWTRKMMWLMSNGAAVGACPQLKR